MKTNVNVKTRKTYPKEFRRSCVERAFKIGNIAACGRELSIPYGVLLSWVNKAKGDPTMPKKKQIGDDESGELQRLKKENRRLAEEVAILKKATAYFSQKELPRGTRL
jgi:transposase